MLFPLLSQAQAEDKGLKKAFKPGGSLDKVAEWSGYEIGAGSAIFDSTVGMIISTALSLLGVVFLILTVYAGYLWMTASGNEDKVSRARNILVTSIIGIIIVTGAYAISYFVLKSVQDQSLTTEISEPENNEEVDGDGK